MENRMAEGWGRRILSVFLLLLALCVGGGTAVQAASKDTREDVTYTDSRGNEIVIKGGADSCATSIVSFEAGDP